MAAETEAETMVLIVSEGKRGFEYDVIMMRSTKILLTHVQLFFRRICTRPRNGGIFYVTNM